MVSQFLKRLFGSSESDGKDSLGLDRMKIKTPTFLVGDFGRAVLEEYKDRVRTDYNGNDSLNVLSLYRDTVVGSNPFAVVLINQIIRAGKLRTYTTQFGLVRAVLDSSRNFYADVDRLRDSNEDGRVVVVGAAHENSGGNQ